MRGEGRGARGEATDGQPEASAPGVPPAPHVIRLRGPWELANRSRIKLPATWRDALGDARSATLSRPFNRPTGLDASGVSVRLRVSSPQSVDRVLLNEDAIADGAELLPLMSRSNRLVVDLSARDPDASILEAWLEIVEG